MILENFFSTPTLKYKFLMGILPDTITILKTSYLFFRIFNFQTYFTFL